MSANQGTETGRTRAIMERRLRSMRARAAIKRYEIRQIAHAGGVWFRLRRLLVDADRVLLVSPDQAARLLAEGFAAHAVGAEFEPAKTIIVVPPDLARRLPAAREVRPAMSAEILSAGCLVLVGF
jgi:hypothetical protein